jgi:uncharacterized protein
MSEIKSAIMAHLKGLESSHGIHILFACESGSRAWGFPSPDSDYDVRFVYVHPLDWYLSINENRDVIELPINAELDISGWDLRKVFRLVAKNNSIIYEWLQSPIVYSEDEPFMIHFTEQMKHCFSPIAAMHHYLSSAKKYYEECLSEQVKLKKYFYCLRCTLASAWIASRQTVPPIEIGKLLSIIDDKALVARILELINLKSIKEESYLHPKEPQLEEYLKKIIEQCESVASSLQKSKIDINHLDASFRTVVKHEY